MTRQDFTLYSYKTDRRTKTGERLVMTRVLEQMVAEHTTYEDLMDVEVRL